MLGFLEFLRRMLEIEAGQDSLEKQVLDAACGPTERLTELLTQHPELLSYRTAYLREPLMAKAAEWGQISDLEVLLSLGASIADRDSGHIHGPGKTPLLAAACAGQVATAVWLLEHGADVNESGGARMMSHQAIDAGWPEEQHKAVIFKGQDGDWNDSGWTALMHAADTADVALLAALLWRGADHSRRSRHGLSALDLAVRGAAQSAEQPERLATFRHVQQLLSWAGAGSEQERREDVGRSVHGEGHCLAASLPVPLPVEALAAAPAPLKQSCRAAALAMHRLGMPQDVVGSVLACVLLLALRQ